MDVKIWVSCQFLLKTMMKEVGRMSTETVGAWKMINKKALWQRNLQ